MRCGNVIVTTNYKYLPEVVKKENGVLVEPKSVDSLIDGIVKILDNEKLMRKMQKHNQKEALEKYSLDKYIHKLQNIVLKY